MKTLKVIEFIDMGIFPGTLMFSSGFSYEEIIRQLKKKGASDWLTGISEDKNLIESGSHFALKRVIENVKTGNSLTMFYIIITEQFKFNDIGYCKLAHECLHICQFFLPDLLDRNKEIEAEAYLHTHLMLNCLKSLR